MDDCCVLDAGHGKAALAGVFERRTNKVALRAIQNQETVVERRCVQYLKRWVLHVESFYIASSEFGLRVRPYRDGHAYGFLREDVERGCVNEPSTRTMLFSAFFTRETRSSNASQS